MADTLTNKSRLFYEYSRFKLALSLVLGGCSLLLMAMCSTSGGIATSYNLFIKNKYFKEGYPVDDDHLLQANDSAAAGYGKIKSFVFLCMLLCLLCCRICLFLLLHCILVFCVYCCLYISINLWI